MSGAAPTTGQLLDEIGPRALWRYDAAPSPCFRCGRPAHVKAPYSGPGATRVLPASGELVADGLDPLDSPQLCPSCHPAWPFAPAPRDG